MILTLREMGQRCKQFRIDHGYYQIDVANDTGYSVESLAEDLCMSRANLHRRMKAAAGMTPTDFIRGQRLERAAWLLRNTSHSVNEISDLVGFSYASYFTKCFKEKYGVLPKDF